jgi:hypothetical protein
MEEQKYNKRMQLMCFMYNYLQSLYVKAHDHVANSRALTKTFILVVQKSLEMYPQCNNSSVLAPVYFII